MVSKSQYQAYKKASTNCNGISEWVRLVLECTILRHGTIRSPLTKKSVRRKKKPIIWEGRTTRLTIKASGTTIDAIRAAAHISNIRMSPFCVLLLDQECGISNLVFYLNSLPSTISAQPTQTFSSRVSFK